ncbi:unnamed protein product [Caenorhabditis auriculariae]|uniref:Uncharacterized protein n=1 Tax=Caenorhabditis auriculariae TaxID=2777116 RepID=A0A8S1GSV9_9PELO|nr:unnamed protein product [Caenorhabditis auriculariae]
MDAETLDRVIAIIVDTIHNIQKALTKPGVRIRADPKIKNPAVDAESSLNDLLKRFRNQTNSAAVLADMAHIGQPANNVEADVLSRIKDTLRNSFDKISLEESSMDSDSARSMATTS